MFATLLLCLRRILPESAGGRLPTVLSSVFATLHLCLRRPILFCLARKEWGEKRRFRPRKLHILRPAASGRAHPFRCSSSPNCNHFVGLQFGILGFVQVLRSLRFVTSKNKRPPSSPESCPNLAVVASEAVPTIPTAQKPRTPPRVRRNCRP